MDKYIEKANLVSAKQMTRAEYHALRGYSLSAEDNPEELGYIIEYMDGSAPNCPEFEGYVYWESVEIFEENFKPISEMTFGHAIEALKLGKKVTRVGWNGKGMFLFLVPGSTFQVNRAPLLGIYPEGTEINYRPHIDMKTADGQIVPWVASQSDVLAEDWQIID